MIADQFWLGITAIYAGLLFLLLDVTCAEPKLRKSLRLAIQICLIAALFVFSVQFVFKDAPLTFEAYMISVPHGDIEIAGINWKDPNLSDVRVWIRNPSDDIYRDVELIVDIDTYLVHAGLLENQNSCSVALPVQVSLSATMAQPDGTQYLITPPIGRTMGLGYKVACEKLAPRSAVYLVIAADTDKQTHIPSLVSVKGKYTAFKRTRRVTRTVEVGSR